jgi:putative Mg2+ transporter-C (MgtC) family protein
MPMTGGELLVGPGEILLRLFVATVIGCVLGLNREIHGKPAGMRTHGLVALGAALISLVAVEVVSNGTLAAGGSVLPVVQGIMAGIGFLGGGVILRDDSHQSVHGLTTAASVWVVASLGIACGLGQWFTAIAALCFTLLVLILLGRVEKRCISWFTRDQVLPVAPPAAPAADARPPGLM